MNVSARVLAQSGEVGHEDFLEKRFFRLQSESLWAAVLFGALETYSIIPRQYWPNSSPISTHTQKTRYDRRDRLLAFLLFGGQSDILAVWNDPVEWKHAIADIGTRLVPAFSPDAVTPGSPALTAFSDALRIRITCNGETLEPTSDWFASLFIVLQDSAVLFYSDYAHESCWVSECGHLSIKYRLFQKVAMWAQNWAVSEEQVMRIYLGCECGQNLSWEVFRLVVEMESERTSRAALADMITTYHVPRPVSRIDSNTGICVICGKPMGIDKSKCKRGCEVCLNCNIKTFMSGAYLWCPFCFEEYALIRLEEFKQHTEVWKLLERKSAVSVCCICRKKPFDPEANNTDSIEHQCKFCTSCFKLIFRQGEQRQCPQCHVEWRTYRTRPKHVMDSSYPLARKQIREEKKNDGQMKVPAGEQIDDVKKFCSCPQLRDCCEIAQQKGKKWLYNGTLYCWKCVIKTNLLGECDKCHSNFFNPECASCKMQFHPSSKFTHTEVWSAVCRNDGLLCQLCIFHKVSQWYCALCSNVVSIDYNTVLERSSLKLSCCDNENICVLRKEKCGHFIHAKEEDCNNKTGYLQCMKCIKSEQ